MKHKSALQKQVLSEKGRETEIKKRTANIQMSRSVEDRPGTACYPRLTLALNPKLIIAGRNIQRYAADP